MPDHKPVAERSISRYGAPPPSWDQARECLEAAGTYWLATVRPDGRPHVMPLFGVWLDGNLCFCAGAATRKSRNLARDPDCVITAACAGLDIVVEGEAAKVCDEARLHRIAEAFASKYDWHVTVRDGAFDAEYGAPSAGPPPFEVYEVLPATVFGLARAEPYGAVRWRF